MIGFARIWKFHPQQIEFARLNLTYVVMSKQMLRLVEEGYVNGWDDPRMPTIALNVVRRFHS